MSMLKHKIKMGLRRSIADTGRISGLWRLINRTARKGRITILTLHCVGFPRGTDYLPDYMKIDEGDFDRLLGGLAGSFEMISLEESLRRLKAGERGKNAVVITLDDGYLDNRTHALPILQKHGIPCTVFLEAGAVDRRSLAWIQKFFFVDKVKGSAFFAKEYIKGTSDSAAADKLRAAATQGEKAEYAVKRVLKYEVDPMERDRVSQEIFAGLGGAEQKILEEAYLGWDDVKAMAEQGVSFGCHTLSHPILATLSKAEARAEIVGARELIKEKSGVDAHTFAYPWGRAWDYNQETRAILEEEGFSCGLAMDEISALPETCDPYNLSRYPLAVGFRTADILAEASGLYGWFGGRI